MEPERQPRQRVASSHGRRLLAFVCLRVHEWQFFHRRRGRGTSDGELWSSAAAAASVATLAALAALAATAVAVASAVSVATATEPEPSATVAVATVAVAAAAEPEPSSPRALPPICSRALSCTLRAPRSSAACCPPTRAPRPAPYALLSTLGRPHRRSTSR